MPGSLYKSMNHLTKDSAYGSAGSRIFCVTALPGDWLVAGLESASSTTPNILVSGFLMWTLRKPSLRISSDPLHMSIHTGDLYLSWGQGVYSPIRAATDWRSSCPSTIRRLGFELRAK